MKSNTKKNAYSKVKALLVKSVNINNFEKNPTNGGTPAIENMIRVIEVKKKLLKLKPWKDCKVLNLVSVELNNVQNKIIREKL
jgi:hypothetical protein